MEMNNLAWRKASQSSTNGGVCVEVARTLHEVAARDSKNPDKGILKFSLTSFKALLADIKSGKYDH